MTLRQVDMKDIRKDIACLLPGVVFGTQQLYRCQNILRCRPGRASAGYMNRLHQWLNGNWPRYEATDRPAASLRQCQAAIDDQGLTADVGGKR